MIAKIREGSHGHSNQSFTSEIILQQCKPRGSLFLKGQPRKADDWKVIAEKKV